MRSDPDKIEAFSEFVHNLGYTLKGINKIHPRLCRMFWRRPEAQKRRP